MAVTNADILGWLNANPNATPELINQTMAEAGVSAAQYQDATGTPPTTAVDTLKQQILSQNTTSQWTGEGYGSAQANAEAMAKLMADAGITDIKQLAVSKEVVPYMAGEWGEIPEHTVSKYYNKETGQEIESGSGRWQNQGGEDLFGGTGEGKGNTGFRVQFSPDGTPVFYTTQGSSSDAVAIMPLIQIALAATGAGGLLGNALLGAGASQVAASALGNAILGGATSSLAGGDALKGALLGGAGGALSGYLQGGPIDASNMTSAQFNDALENQLIKSMQGAGLTTQQIGQWLENASPTDIASITSALPVTNASDNLLVNAAKTPITADALINTLSQVPNIITTGAKTPQQVSPDVLSGVTSMLSGATTTPQTVEVTDQNPNKADNSGTIPLITAPITTTIPTVTAPTVPTTTTTGGTTTDNKLTTSDVIRILGIGTTIAGINAATGNGTGGTGGTTGGTQFPIVGVPSDWRTPPKPSVATATALPPINFGDRNLLIGTQWEKFLDPNYGQVPEPVQYSQPSNLSYNDLMGILGSKQGMPPASSLSINDIISGIQNQYGQANRSAMG